MISDKEWFERKFELIDYFQSNIFYADIYTHGKNIGRIDGKLVLVDYNYHIVREKRGKLVRLIKILFFRRKAQVIT